MAVVGGRVAIAPPAAAAKMELERQQGRPAGTWEQAEPLTIGTWGGGTCLRLGPATLLPPTSTSQTFATLPTIAALSQVPQIKRSDDPFAHSIILSKHTRSQQFIIFLMEETELPKLNQIHIFRSIQPAGCAAC